MDFYFVEKDQVLQLPIDGEEVTYIFLKADPQKITADRLYFAPSDEIKRVIERFHQAGYTDFAPRVFLDKRQIFEHPKFPLDLTYSGGYFRPEEKFVPLEEKIKPLLGREKIRVAIINGMGGGIGDNIVGMTALNILYDRLMHYFREVDIGVFTLRPRALPILRQETIINEIYLMPAPAELLFQYDALINLSNMTGWPIFKQEMVDFYLQAMSIEPQSVSSSEKRCFIKLNERIVRELEPIIKALKTARNPLLLYHPISSSPIRSIPRKIINKHIKRILEITDFLVVSLLPINFKHPRFVNLHSFSKKGFDHFAYLISQMDAIITVDTAVYHVADAFSVPTVTLFTSIPPEHRISYYPYQKGLLIGGPKGRPLFYRHASDNKEELKLLEEKWRRFKIDKALEGLKELIEKRSKISKIPCPVCENKVPFIPSDRYRNYRHLRCNKCEAEFAWPRKAMDYARAYQVAKTESGDEYQGYLREEEPEKLYQGLINNPRFQAVKDFLETLPEKGSLLDVGCANGFFVRYAKELGFEAFGIDLSPEAIAYGQKYYGVPLALCGDLQELPQEFPEKFQVITAFELLEHLENPGEFVEKVRERLLEGGIFLFSTPNREMLGRRFGLKDERQFFIPGHRDAPPGHLTRFSASTHRHLLEERGFEILWQWVVPPLVGDLERVLGECLKVPNLKVEAGNGRNIEIAGERLKPLLRPALQVILPLLQEQGLFLITAAKKKAIL